MNRTLTLDEQDRVRLAPQILYDLPSKPFSAPPVGTIRGDCLEVAKILPPNFVDLLVLDPPYRTHLISSLQLVV